MADLVLIRFGARGSPASRRALLKRLREAAVSALPSGRNRKVGTIGGQRFKIILPDGEGSVDPSGAYFDLDSPDFATVRLIHDVAKAGRMTWVDAWGRASTIVFDRADLKSLPLKLRRPKPAVCTSAKDLARMMGISTKGSTTTADSEGQQPWFKGVNPKSRQKLPGLAPPAEERYLYTELLPGESVTALMKTQWAFIRAGKKQGKFELPQGGGISFGHWDNWQVRLPTGQVLIPLHVAGYESRPNKDHLIPANLAAWTRIARAFASATRRKTAEIEDGKTLVVFRGGRYPITKIETRRFEVD